MKLEDIESNLIVKLCFNFPIEIIAFCKILDSDKNFSISKQLFRSGTSIGANIMEAQNAESKNDFIHKFKIDAKEADEIQYWLLLCQKSIHLPNSNDLLIQLDSIQKIIASIISSTKNKIKTINKGFNN